MRIIFGLLLAFVGVAVVIYTQWNIENIGTNAWAEAKFGTAGGSRMMYKLIGLGLIFIGFLLVTNLFGGFLFATVGKIFIR